jgi:hypothetical protein
MQVYLYFVEWVKCHFNCSLGVKRGGIWTVIGMLLSLKSLWKYAGCVPDQVMNSS